MPFSFFLKFLRCVTYRYPFLRVCSRKHLCKSFHVVTTQVLNMSAVPGRFSVKIRDVRISHLSAVFLISFILIKQLAKSLDFHIVLFQCKVMKLSQTSLGDRGRLLTRLKIRGPNRFYQRSHCTKDLHYRLFQPNLIIPPALFSEVTRSLEPLFFLTRMFLLWYLAHFLQENPYKIYTIVGNFFQHFYMATPMKNSGFLVFFQHFCLDKISIMKNSRWLVFFQHFW